jgi:hypothetical protein
MPNRFTAGTTTVFDTVIVVPGVACGSAPARAAIDRSSPPQTRIEGLMRSRRRAA